jgi:Na+-transporting methylmalonyl-CoA/oxaloacetate decarboxylase gamma subunit
MVFLRQYVAPFLILLVFLVALLAVTVRSFLPADMAAPAPMEEINPPLSQAELPPAVILMNLGW